MDKIHTSLHIPGMGTVLASLGILWGASASAIDYDYITNSVSWSESTAWSPNAPVGGPGASDNINNDQAVQTTLPLDGVDRFANEITKTGSARWNVRNDNATFATVSAQKITGTTSNFIFQNGTSTTATTGGMAVEVVDIDVSAGTTYFGATASGVQYTNLLYGLNVTGSTKVSGGGLNINVADDSFSLGQLDVTGGTVTLSINSGAKSVYPTVNVTGLSGSGGAIQGTSNAGAPADTTADIHITNTIDYNFGSVLKDSPVNDGSRGVVSIVKAGSGTQTLSGDNLYTGATTITEGALLVDGTHTGGGDYTVSSGGTLGGSGSIDATGITVADGGFFAPTDENFDVTLSGSLDLSAVATADSLLFSLDTPGSSSMVTILGGTLNIGVLDFSEFDFTTLGGFGAGDYTLFDASSTISGSIGTASGLLGAFNGTLSLDSINNDIVLTVSAVPEPTTFAAISGLMVLGLCWLRRNRHSC